MTCGCGLGRGVRGREFSSTRSNPAEDPTLIAYRAMLDVPRELVLRVGQAAARRAPRPRHPEGDTPADLLPPGAAGAGVVAHQGRGRGHRRRVRGAARDRLPLPRRGHQGARRAGPRPARGLAGGGRAGLVARRARRQADPHRPLRRDHRQRKGETINAWYSGKHRAPGGNVQAVIRPDGLPILSPTSRPVTGTT